MTDGAASGGREKERLARIGAAAPLLAHQLCNPVNGISAAVQLLEHCLCGAPPSIAQAMLTVCDLKKEVRQLTALLNGFKSIAAPQKLALAPLDAARLIRSAVGAIETASARQRIKLSVDCDANLPQLNGDADKLTRALLAALENSVEAMPDGGSLAVDARRQAQALSIDIIDTGGGIPAGIKPFDPFISTKPERCGLGLFIAQQIVIAHDGNLSCLSIPGQGTTVQFTLPYIDPAARD